VDFDIEGGLSTIRAAKQQNPPVPTIALTSNSAYREQAVAAGTDELLPNPPPFAELQVVLVRALGKPLAIRPMAQSGAVDVDV
jgi:CheY-like chemotaxis protein